MELQEILEKRDRLREAYEIAEQNTPYAKTNKEIEKAENKIAELKKKIAKLQEKANKQRDKHYKMLDSLPSGYTLTTLDLIAKELLERNPKFKSYYVIGTFGCNCESSIWFFEDELGYTGDLDRIKASLTFFSDALVWTGEVNDNVDPHSLAYLNGDNKVMVMVTSIEQLNELLQKSYKGGKQ